jgi:hypothetical protein
MKYPNVRPLGSHHQRGGPETVVLFAVAHQTFAIAADAVQEFRSTDGLAAAATEIEDPELPKVRHTFDRGRRTYYIVNAGMHFGLPVTRPTLVLILRRLRAAVLVDRIERMAEIPSLHPLPQAFTGEARQWYRGLAYLEDQVIPVLNPCGFLTAQEFEQLDRLAGASSSERQTEGAIRA